MIDESGTNHHGIQNLVGPERFEPSHSGERARIEGKTHQNEF